VAASDFLTIEEISHLLRQTGHPASASTLRRWIKRNGVYTERRGRADYASFSDVLLVHKKMITKRDGTW
jgi:hypothetical protein